MCKCNLFSPPPAFAWQLDFHRGLVVPERGLGEEPPGPTARPPERDQRAEREREMERRERARGEREWDRDKVRDFGRPGEEREGAERRSRSRDRERRRKERGKSKERKADKKGVWASRTWHVADSAVLGLCLTGMCVCFAEKAPEEPPAKLLDDLFYKTKAAPCIYWLPLTDEQVWWTWGSLNSRIFFIGGAKIHTEVVSTNDRF